MTRKLFPANAQLLADDRHASDADARSFRFNRQAHARLSRSKALKQRTVSTANFLRSAGQGACAAVLAALAGQHFLASDAPARLQDSFAAGGVTIADPISVAALAGGAPAILEALGATALFASAGEGLGRLFGVGAAATALLAYANGIDGGDLATIAADLGGRLQGLADPLKTLRTL